MQSESEDEISLSGSDSEDPAAEEIDNEEMIIEDEPPTSDGECILNSEARILLILPSDRMNFWNVEYFDEKL